MQLVCFFACHGFGLCVLSATIRAMNDKALKTRFAPSPTGLLHLGNVRTALFNWLVARGRGDFLLRLEDTDAARSETQYAEALQEDMQWLGLNWSEGPVIGGDYGPYVQSERGAIYDKYFSSLIEAGRAYPCFCSEHELKLSRKSQLAAGRPPRYRGRCRNLSAEEVAAKHAEGVPATLRFHVEDGRAVMFTDRVRGPQRFETQEIGDFIIRRSDGTPAFFFCNAVDDALMAVSLVVRGEDHLTNTPRQLLLLEALGLPAPDYAHIALVVGSDGAPLSKRNGSQTVASLREAGFLPGAVINYLARLGHTYDEHHYLAGDELAAAFDSTRLHKAPARYDAAQLEHWQREAIAAATVEDLWAWINEGSRHGLKAGEIVPADKITDFVGLIRANITMPDEAVLWAANLYAVTGIYDPKAREAICDAGVGFFDAALDALNDAADFKAWTRAISEAASVKGKGLFMPLRAALTGEHAADLPSLWQDGPELSRVWHLLGSEATRRRLMLARAMCD